MFWWSPAAALRATAASSFGADDWRHLPEHVAAAPHRSAEAPTAPRKQTPRMRRRNLLPAISSAGWRSGGVDNGTALRVSTRRKPLADTALRRRCLLPLRSSTIEAIGGDFGSRLSLGSLTVTPDSVRQAHRSSCSTTRCGRLWRRSRHLLVFFELPGLREARRQEPGFCAVRFQLAVEKP
jgi:hypothetical protein